MSRATFFVQSCPSCGRRLQIRVAYLGRVVCCQHCDREFEAQDPANLEIPQPDTDQILLRANELLAGSANRNRPK